MKRYLATFKIPAEVIVQFEVSALSQQEGIVAAHDHVLLVTADSAKIETLFREGATNIAFEPISADAASDESGPLDFTAELFDGRDCEGAVVLTRAVASLEQGKALLEGLIDSPLSERGSGRVLDNMGLNLFSVSAARGGWEVEAYVSGGPGEMPVLKERATWLSSREKALEVAKVLVGMGYSLKIFDFNDRVKGPVLWRCVG